MSRATEPGLNHYQPLATQETSDVLPGIPRCGREADRQDPAADRRLGVPPRAGEATAAGVGPDTKAGEVVSWLKTTYGIGHGHANAMSLPRKREVPPVIRNGPVIGDKHVGTTGSHRDESNTLRLDGIANR
jgi:hypothetical protein